MSAVTQTERTFLTPSINGGATERSNTYRRATFNFLNANTDEGELYELIMTVVIGINIISFVMGTEEDFYKEHAAIMHNIEIFTVFLFTLDYTFRVWSQVEERDKETGAYRHKGCSGRIVWMFTDLFSWIDILSILPFWLNTLTPMKVVTKTQFIRSLRTLRLLHSEGSVSEAWRNLYKIVSKGRHVFETTTSIAVFLWIICSAAYYLAERNSCYNRFESIPSAMYWCLINLFGEYPLIDSHSTMGKIVASFVAIFAVGIFAVPCGVLGAGFQSLLEEERAEEDKLKQQLSDTGIMNKANISNVPNDLKATPLNPNHRGHDSNNPPKWSYQCYIYRVLNGFTTCTLSKVVDNTIGLSVMISIITICLYSVRWIALHPKICVGLKIAEAITTILFTIEYVVRLWAAGSASRYYGFFGRIRYILTPYALIDLFSIMPVIILHEETNISIQDKHILLMSSMIRVFKFERLTQSFFTFYKVLSKSVSIIKLGFFITGLCWLFASTLMWLFERNNPDDDIRKYYTSVPSSAWITLLNLTGECPLADYTIPGKILTGFLGIFAVGIFAVPVGIIGAAWEDMISAVDEVSEESADDEDPLKVLEAFQGSDGIEKLGLEELDNHDFAVQVLEREDDELNDHEYSLLTTRQKIYAFLHGYTKVGKYFEMFIFFVIIVSVVEAILESVGPMNEKYGGIFAIIEVTVIAIFTVEYIARFWCCPENPKYSKRNLDDSWARFRHVTSVFAIIDLLAIFPFYALLIFPELDKYDEFFRMLRLFRLVMMEKYIPAFSLLDDVFRKKRHSLSIAALNLLVIWIFATTALHLTEQNTFIHSPDADDMTMAWRYRNIPNSLQYTMIHLTGDFPLIDYSMYGRLVCVFVVTLAVTIVGVPAGIIATGFSEVLEDKRKSSRDARQKAIILLQRNARRWLDMRRFKMLKMLQDEAVAFSHAHVIRKAERSKELQAELGCMTFYSLKFIQAQNVQICIIVLILLNIVSVILESCKSIKHYTKSMPQYFDYFETFSIIVFTVEYIIRIVSASANSHYYFSRRKMIFSFFGIIDMLCILPWYIQKVMQMNGDTTIIHAAPFRVIRIFRILQLDRFMSSFTIFSDIYHKSKNTLKAVGLLALIIWIIGGSLFFLFDPEIFENIPNSLYYTAVFLGGEWGVIDYSVANKFTCIMFCIIGITMFAIPIATMFEAFVDTLQDFDDDMEKEFVTKNQEKDVKKNGDDVKKNQAGTNGHASQLQDQDVENLTFVDRNRTY